VDTAFLPFVGVRRFEAIRANDQQIGSGIAGLWYGGGPERVDRDKGNDIVR